MVSKRKVDKNFGHLSQELQLMVTDYLPYDDKIKLFDIFPPVISQIDTFDTSKYARSYGRSVSQAEVAKSIESCDKLTKVRKVVYPGPYDETDESLLEVISRSTNKDIQCFKMIGDGPPGNFDVCALNYIKNILRSDPSFDASRIDYVFTIEDRINLLRDHPQLKLKLTFFDHSSDHQQHLTDDKIRNMITVVDSSGDNNNDPLQQFILPSVDHIILFFSLVYDEIYLKFHLKVSPESFA